MSMRVTLVKPKSLVPERLKWVEFSLVQRRQTAGEGSVPSGDNGSFFLLWTLHTLPADWATTSSSRAQKGKGCKERTRSGGCALPLPSGCPGERKVLLVCNDLSLCYPIVFHIGIPASLY